MMFKFELPGYVALDDCTSALELLNQWFEGFTAAGGRAPEGVEALQILTRALSGAVVSTEAKKRTSNKKEDIQPSSKREL